MKHIENFEDLLRLQDIIGPLGPLPISRSTWYAGVRAGIYPKPIKIGARAVAWKASDLRSLTENGIDGGAVK